MLTSRTVFLLFGWLFVPLVVAAQTLRPEVISTEHGLSQGFVSNICQDDEGFLWFGTGGGLNRYDGYEFLVFKHDPYDPLSLPGNSVVGLNQAGEFLCVVTREGVSLFHRRTRRFFLLPQTVGLPAYSVASVHTENARTVWVALFQHGGWRLHHLSWPDNLAEQLQTDPDAALRQVRFEPKFTDLQIINYTISEDCKNLWMASGNSSEVYRVSLPDCTLSTIPQPTSNVRNNELVCPPDETFWVSDAVSSSFFLYNDNAPDGQQWRTIPMDKTTRLNVIKVDFKHQLLWVGALTTVWGFDLRTTPKAITRANARYVLEVPDIALRGFVDRDGVLWIATDAKGIRKFNPGTAIFTNYAEGHSVYCPPVADYEGRIWLGNLDNRTFNRRFSRSDGSDADYGLTTFSNTRFEVKAVAGDHGELWLLGTNHQPKLARYVPGKGETESFALPHPLLLPPALYYDTAQRQVWLADGEQLTRFDVATRQFKKFETGLPPAQQSWGLALTRTADGSFWVALETGLLRARPQGESFLFELLKNNPADRNSLPGNSIKSLLTDPTDGQVLWVGTAGRGLCRYDLRNNTFRHFDTRNGLSDDVVYSILAENADPASGDLHLWLSTNRGLVRFNPRRNVFSYFVKSDGLQDNEFNTFASGKTPEGHLMFGGVNGLTVFDPALLRASAAPAQTLLTGLKVNNRWVSPRDSAALLAEGVEFTRSISLAHDQNNLYLQFAVANLANP